MNKFELTQLLKDATDVSKSEATAVVDIIFRESSHDKITILLLGR